MGGVRTVRPQSTVDMDGFPAFSGEVKAGGSVLVFAVTTVTKAAKKLDRLHSHGLPKLRKNMSVGKLLAQLAGGVLGNTVWSIRTVRTVLAFALLVILMRQTLTAHSAGVNLKPRRDLDWMADFGPMIDAGYSCTRNAANKSILISDPQVSKPNKAPAGLFLGPPPPNKAHLKNPPPTLAWFGPTPGSWAGGSSPMELLPVSCSGKTPDKFYCCLEVRKLMSAFRAAGVTSAGSLTQCMVHVKGLLSSHVSFDALSYCGVDVMAYASPSREQHVLDQLRPDTYGHILIALKDDQFTLPNRAVSVAQNRPGMIKARRLSR